VYVVVCACVCAFLLVLNKRGIERKCTDQDLLINRFGYSLGQKNSERLLRSSARLQNYIYKIGIVSQHIPICMQRLQKLQVKAVRQRARLLGIYIYMCVCVCVCEYTVNIRSSWQGITKYTVYIHGSDQP